MWSKISTIFLCNYISGTYVLGLKMKPHLNGFIYRLQPIHCYRYYWVGNCDCCHFLLLFFLVNFAKNRKIRILFNVLC